MNVYLDNAATTKIRPEAKEAMLRAAAEEYGNPSSSHIYGRIAAASLETARKNIALALGAKSCEIFFTSGGTESDNWAVFGSAEAFWRRGKHIITSQTEHEAVLAPIKKLENAGWAVTYLAPDSTGRVSADAFSAALREDTAFASIMLVNNETGTINPISEYSAAIKQRGLKTVLHTDAVQGFCKLPFTVKSLNADLLTVSGHKIHGAKGAGALFIKNGIKLPPILLGGGQEQNLRSGTEATPAIAAFGTAAYLGALELEETAAAAMRLREYVSARLSGELPDAVIIGGGSPFILCISLPGYRAEVLATFLESEGICVSKGAACKKGARSRVLESMRLKNDIIDGALRVSFSRFSTLYEAEQFVNALKKASEKLLRALK